MVRSPELVVKNELVSDPKLKAWQPQLLKAEAVTEAAEVYLIDPQGATAINLQEQ